MRPALLARILRGLAVGAAVPLLLAAGLGPGRWPALGVLGVAVLLAAPWIGLGGALRAGSASPADRRLAALLALAALLLALS